MTPQSFIQKWGPGGPAFHLNEEQGAQSHFLDLCELLGVPKPGSEDGYLFEEKSNVIGGRTGYADVFRRGAFAWENKAPGKNLDAALKQLLTYSLALSNPPILVVCDRLTIRIHTQFTGHPTETHHVLLQTLDQPDKLALLRRIWLDPESFRPKKTSRDITEQAAKSFATLADSLRKNWKAPADAGGPDSAAHQQAFQAHADAVAHFLTQCLFCFFAEDVGLLPGRMFEGLVNNRKLTSDKLTLGMGNLFAAMQQGGLYGSDEIPWFNGGLFKTIRVPLLNVLDVTELRNAAGLNWSAIDVSIFGTLFERGLDPSKRSQLGAHYTDPATIMRIVEPVLQRPLLQIWEQVAQEIRGLLAKSSKKGDKNHKLAQAAFVQWLDQLKDYRVLDPACGSGNFLFLGLKTLKDIEHQSHIEAAAMGLDRQADLVTGPHNMLGIELNEYAAELARVTVWIGELQWRLLHGYEFKTNPVLEPLDNIECRDALLTWHPVEQKPASNLGSDPSPKGAGSDPNLRTSQARAVEAPWPQASVVIGNPPFLGDRKMIRELGEEYTFTLRKVYEGRVPGGADLVCYWFEKARTALETQGLGAAGLVATNSIRGGANRKVLEAICKLSRIYDAWSDEGWVNEGADVRVSLICFGHASQTAQLDGVAVEEISTDVSAKQGVSDVKRLAVNTDASFIGTQKNGPFDIAGDLAREWMRSPNPHGQSNARVLRPWVNGINITRRGTDTWIIDFDKMKEQDAALFEKPFHHAVTFVKPTRLELRRDWHRLNWWCHGDPRPAMKLELKALSRQLITPRVSKHRVFAWFDAAVLADSAVVTITRADDTTFGILHSRFHELWSLRMGTWLGVGNDPRYTPTTCFETFPFPAGLTPADTAHQQTEAIEGGALIPAGLLSTPVRTEVSKPRDAQAPFDTLCVPCPEPVEGSGRTEKKESQLAGVSPSNRPPAQSIPAQAAIKSIATASSLRTHAEAIARAAHRLNALREAWLNPPAWTERVPEVIPLGLQTSPYPDRIVAKAGYEKDLAERTLTRLYNQRPAWLHAAHQSLDEAVAAAYGWADYTPDMPDEEILKRLLALNLARAGAA